jgi:hypothetical protein
MIWDAEKREVLKPGSTIVELQRRAVNADQLVKAMGSFKVFDPRTNPGAPADPATSVWTRVAREICVSVLLRDAAHSSMPPPR